MTHIELRKQAVVSSLRQELERFAELQNNAKDAGTIAVSRRKILGYCEELDAIEILEARAA